MSYEEELSEALRRTGEGFGADRQALVEAGHARGRRLVARRRATVFGGAAAVAALAVTGAVAVPGMGGGDRTLPAAGGGRSSASPAEGGEGAAGEGTSSAAAGKDVSGEELIKTLTSLLPEGRVTESSGRGTDEALGANAQVVFDDGKGEAMIGVSFNRVDGPDSPRAKEQTACPDKARVLFDRCADGRLQDGSRLMVLQGYVYSDHRAGTKEWTATLVTPEGHVVTASEVNAAGPKQETVTREQPPLSAEQLKKLAMSDKWDPVFDAPVREKPGASGEGKGEGEGEPGHGGTWREGAMGDPSNQDGTGPKGAEPEVSEPPATPAQEEIRATLKSLLPKDVKVLRQGGQGQYAYVVVDDGNGASLVQINVQPDMLDVRDDLFTEADRTPSGLYYKWRESAGDKGVEGAVMWTADSMRPAGLRVVVSAFNASTQRDAPSRKTPALDEAQLKAIVTSTKWDAL